MTIKDIDEEFVNSIKSELKDSVNNINACDLSSITQARHQATTKKAEGKLGWIFLPAGAIATAFLAVLIFNVLQVTPVSTDGQDFILENQELVTAVENFDFYEEPEISEELDFYEWLDAYESSNQS